MPYHDIVIKIKNIIFVAKTGNYDIFVAKICDYKLIDSFRGSAGIIYSPTSCHAVVVYFALLKFIHLNFTPIVRFWIKCSPLPVPPVPKTPQQGRSYSCPFVNAIFFHIIFFYLKCFLYVQFFISLDTFTIWCIFLDSPLFWMQEIYVWINPVQLCAILV